MHGTGHGGGAGLQGDRDEVDGKTQGFPRPTGPPAYWRARLCEPMPQETEHAPHAAQDSAQFAQFVAHGVKVSETLLAQFSVRYFPPGVEIMRVVVI